jgi:SAM-dependent methyltransferase
MTTPPDPRAFGKQDPSPDPLFYAQPRKVVHIDGGAIRALTALYRELLPAGGALLDLMTSWRSHLPPGAPCARVAGLGLNAEEMADNPQLTDFIIHDLNADPTLPYAAAEFDAACCAVSVQYLQQPVAVFRDVARVLKPGGVFVVSFSNRCFPTKAVNGWLETNDEEHVRRVAGYFADAGGWSGAQTRDCTPVRARVFGGDPLFAVWAKAGGATAGSPRVW